MTTSAAPGGGASAARGERDRRRPDEVRRCGRIPVGRRVRVASVEHDLRLGIDLVVEVVGERPPVRPTTNISTSVRAGSTPQTSTVAACTTRSRGDRATWPPRAGTPASSRALAMRPSIAVSSAAARHVLTRRASLPVRGTGIADLAQRPGEASPYVVVRRPGDPTHFPYGVPARAPADRARPPAAGRPRGLRPRAPRGRPSVARRRGLADARRRRLGGRQAPRRARDAEHLGSPRRARLLGPRAEHRRGRPPGRPRRPRLRLG